MTRRIACVLLGALLLLLSACAPSAVTDEVLWHMDTAITVRVYGEHEAGKTAIATIDDILNNLDAALSVTDPTGPLYAFNASSDGRDITLDDQTLALIDQALAISRATGGAFDITTAPLTALWQESEQANTLPSQEQIVAALSLVGSEHLFRDGHTLIKDTPDTRIDLGGIGKGYAVDRALDALANADGITAALISFGSNVAVVGEKPDGSPWKIALRDPNDATGTLGYIHLIEGQVLSVSGDYERFFTVKGQNYSHILDPMTGYPPQNGLRSVAVLCESGTLADALSTALLVMGESAARALYESGTFDFEAVFIYDDRVSLTDHIELY